jgi:hypothetical protein
MRLEHIFAQNQESDENEDVQVVLTGNRVINFSRNGNWIYEVFIEDLRTSTGVLAWCRQLSEKSWMSPRLIGEFCTLAMGAMDAR